MEIGERRTMVKAVVAAAFFAVGIGIISAAGCGRSIYPETTSSPTATPTAVSGSFAYVTNNHNGSVSEFSVGTNGRLSFLGSVNAGATRGPTGIAIGPSNNYVYVANSSDDSVYSFHITVSGQLAGKGSVSDGKGSAPSQIALSPNGKFAYVTNQGSGSVSAWKISSGVLSFNGKLKGLGSPIGIAVDPSGQYLYVADNGTGALWSYGINTDGTIASPGSNVPSLGTAAGTPEMLTLGSSGFLYLDDFTAGAIAEFFITNGLPSYVGPLVSTGGAGVNPVGLAITPDGLNLYAANQSGNTVASFSISNSVMTPTGLTPTDNGPTGIAIDSASQFLYVANQSDGTISQFSINGACGNPLCLVATVDTLPDNPGKGGPQFIALTN